MKQSERYSGQTIIMLFLLFSHIGWLWEVILTVCKTGIFVNRGFMHGPWLPVYGVGAMILMVIYTKVKACMSVVFFSSAIICGVLEYMTSWFMEVFFHAKWWDYNGMFMNIHGRTCGLVMILFGCCGCILAQIVQPLTKYVNNRISLKMKNIICWSFGIVFGIDYLYSLVFPNYGFGITS